MMTRSRRNSPSSPLQQQQQQQQQHQSLHRESREYESRDRSRLALIMSHPQQRKHFWLFLVACLFYGYAFFHWQPNRSFAEIHRWNLRLQQRHELRMERAQRSQRNQPYDLDLMEPDEGPEWQRKMRASAGDMAWRKEQEQLAAIAAGHSTHYLRGNSHTDEVYDDEEEDGIEGNDNHHQKRTRRRSGTGVAQTLMDFIIVMSVFAITRTVVRFCLFYRQFSRMMMESTTMTSINTVNTGGLGVSGAIPTNRGSNTNSGRAALARLMVPQSIHAHAALLRTARFRAWVTQLNRERQQHGQPPLSLESLRLVMRDSDFNGDDYEGLMRFHDEVTASSASTTNSLGATQAEIDSSSLVRVLDDPRDELLRSVGSHNNNNNNNSHECPICLDSFQLHDRVRRITCFHEFHVQCIDPWLTHRAVCPVCKTHLLD